MISNCWIEKTTIMLSIIDDFQNNVQLRETFIESSIYKIKQLFENKINTKINTIFSSIIVSIILYYMFYKKKFIFSIFFVIAINWSIVFQKIFDIFLKQTMTKQQNSVTRVINYEIEKYMISNIETIINIFQNFFVKLQKRRQLIIVINRFWND